VWSEVLCKQVGVPQRTLSGPRFWLAFINSSKTTVSQTTYAVVYSGHRFVTHDWVEYGLGAKRNFLKMEKVLPVTQHRSKQAQDKTILIKDRDDLVINAQAKFLGVAIDSKLSFTPHVNNVIKTASKWLYSIVQMKKGR